MGENLTFAMGKILFVPLDSRPITNDETALAAKKAGCDVLTPPVELLGAESRSGEPEKLWAWLEKNAPGSDALVISSDSMLYGSLVDSRKHTLTDSEVQNRVLRFKKLHQDYPNLKIYAYGTILRTLLSMNHSGSGMEPATYQANAVKIYKYSALLDKSEMGQASGREKRELKKLETDIDKNVMQDWQNRHSINFNANKTLLDLTKEGVFSFCLLGGDDSARLSATHREARLLKDYAAGKAVWRTKFQVLSGADELGMMMLSRAVLDIKNEIPFVHIVYNDGVGKNTIPDYCFESLENEMKGAILACGAMEVPDPARADTVLLINTFLSGKTFSANDLKKNKAGKKPNASTEAFMRKLRDSVQKGYPVAVGDISFSNGSDNDLMEAMRRENLQYKIKAYGGWNTATNTLGFLMGEMFLVNFMPETTRNELMTRRYLDEWAYQSNLRQDLLGTLSTLPGKTDSSGFITGEKKQAAEDYLTKKMREFAKERLSLPQGLSLDKLRVTLPWKRAFECKIEF